MEGLQPQDILGLLDRADQAVEVSRQVEKIRPVLRGRTQINLFFEASTRTQSSFEIAGKRLGADVMNMQVSASSVKKGETLIDTAATPKETGIPQRGARPRQVKAERRSDQMSVRMKPSTRALIESLADAEGVPIAEIVERAIAAYAKPA